ncbi:thioredoxin family protein [Tenacibaculum jejuense]|uniref:Thiol-disulfide isomerase or thioredoxin n=1 Tax=Tenacibaculum jejuense TaxID=584609 RepID=A0A238U9D8_9FLAO|nr:thioredoxin family protein [Tenacibaculum jejuense]SNR15030.1 Thiol-disulfide isomerase or thioredoxin [Tenacibaculum jejuense]
MKIFKSVFVLLVLVASVAFTVKDKGAYKIGDKVDNFMLKNIDGKMVSLSDYNNVSGVVVIFTCNHCPYSKMYEDRIIALDKTYKDMGFPVVAINPNDPSVSQGDDYESMKVRAKEKGFTFPYLFDEGQKVYPKFGATKTPHTFILKRKKKDFILSYIGAIDNNARDASNASVKYVEEAILSLIDGDMPTKTETKAIGCSIKTKK